MILENLDFEKQHGLGNDYVVINNLKWKIPDDKKADLAKLLCQPHFSVGADGLLFVCDSEKADIRMRMFNPDGSEAEMCGNGIRCFSKYIYENDILKNKDIKIETPKGIIINKLKVEGNKVISVKVDMGSPILDCESIPVELDDIVDRCVNEQIVILDKIFNFTAVSMGNPHAVIFTQNVISDNDLNKYGAAIESNEHFPNKTNVEFVKIISKREARLRVFERGIGITLSCGTGTCAAVVAGTILGLFEKNVPIIVHNDGGDLIITFNGKKVFMEGPIVKVFKGFIDKIEF
ncbi:MAG: diaminopimelate epimerase [Promethearchaeota archaeon]|jgi:diaminopimelate epimerase